MYVLGIGDHISGGAALLKDGRVVASIIDERLVREKMVFGVPRESIRKVMELEGIAPEQIDLVACGSINQHLINRHVDFRNGWFGLERGPVKKALFALGSKVSKYRKALPFLEPTYYLVRKPFYARRRRTLRQMFREEFGIQAPVQFVNHHFCHITGAYYSSPFDEATVISIDGGGDGLSAMVCSAKNGRFTEMTRITSFDSLGAFYSYITQICGFKAGRHEGKITGLAAHGEPKYIDILRRLIVHENGQFRNIGNVFFYSALDELRHRLPENFGKANLACSIQDYVEEMVVEFVKYWLAKTGKYNVALAGGLFGNVKINQRVHEIPGVTGTFVHQGMSDEGMGLGAALAAYYENKGWPAKKCRSNSHVYLGPEYTEDEIRKEIETSDFEFERHEDVEVEIARLLHEGYVVARFDGRMEYGPRALGNRTIMCSPTDESVNDWLNDCLQRTEFMPFAPATLYEDAEECYHGLEGAHDTARFMTITVDCKSSMCESCPGVVHIDGTARPQLVTEKDNPSFYRVLKEYKKLSGLSSLINTSFNIHEEPIVCTPADAVRAFKIGHLDYLAIGKFVVPNPNRKKRVPGKKKPLPVALR